VKEQGRASRFAPWRIAALALSGEPRFKRYLGSRHVLTAEELEAFRLGFVLRPTQSLNQSCRFDSKN
jgi:hypothetical protein